MADRVLVVDDERNNRAALAKILEKAGHEVVAAASGEDALAALQDAGFDLVVTDLRMIGTRRSRC